MKSIVMQGLGGSATFTLPLGLASDGGEIQAIRLVADVTIAQHADNTWTFAVANGVTSVGTGVSNVAAAITAKTVYDLTVGAARHFNKGDAFQVTGTKAASGVDQSATKFTCVIEYV